MILEMFIKLVVTVIVFSSGVGLLYLGFYAGKRKHSENDTFPSCSQTHCTCKNRLKQPH